MIEFVEYILDESAWLYTRIYQNQLFFIDLWSFVHLWTGFVLYLLFRAAGVQKPMLLLVLLLILYEIVEVLFVYFAFMIFLPETIKDQFTDIILGISGGGLCCLMLALVNKYHDKYPVFMPAFMAFLASSSFAFFWVGFYHYKYNVDFYNTTGINVSTFAGWTLGGMLVIFLFQIFKKQMLIARLGLTWLIFFLFLLAFEYFFYYLLNVRETTGLPLKPLIFGLIHGTLTLHIVYLIAPFIFISLYTFGCWLVKRSSQTISSSCRR